MVKLSEMPLSYHTYNGKEILKVNFNECKTKEEMLALVDKLLAEVNTSNKEMRVLSNYEGVFLGTDFMNKVKESAKKINRPIEKSAVVGVDGMKRILMNAYNKVTGRKMVAFNSEQEALDFLVS